MTTSHNTHRSITGLRHSAKRLLTFTSTKPNHRPYGSTNALDRDFSRVAHDLDAVSRHTR
jgi:hypothetical protein